MSPLLEVEDLGVELAQGAGQRMLVRGVSLSVEPGEIYGLVGESGSGKSLTARAITHALPRGLAATGTVRFLGEETQALSASALRAFLTHGVGMVFQDPRAHVNPVQRIDDFLVEALRYHGSRDGNRLTRAEQRRRAGQLLESIGISDPERVMRSYPHELSGGLLQRVMIASVLIMRPRLVLADEPTTALDVTTQAEVIKALVGLRDEHDMAVVLITHDLDLAASVCDRISVMYAGSVVETRPVRELYEGARHPYSQGLLLSRPRLQVRGSAMPTMPGRPTVATEAPAGECAFAPRCWAVEDDCRSMFPPLVGVGQGTARCLHIDITGDRSKAVSWPAAIPASTDGGLEQAPILEVRELRKVFTRRRREPLVAVDSVSFQLRPGGSLAIIGESGSGKTTTARMILGLEGPTAGQVIVNGEDWTDPSRRTKARRSRARFAQMVFQDPLGSLDPSQTILSAMTEIRQTHFDENRASSESRAREIADHVGLHDAQLAARPLRLSGGQRQRAAIAKALAVEPALLVLDEPASALDVSIQAGIINLLNRLRGELGLTYLLISHDLGVVAQLAEEALVMRSGEVVERGSIDDILRSPAHAYTRELEASIPQPAWIPRDDNRVQHKV